MDMSRSSNRQVSAAAQQDQFLDVISRDEAAARFHRHLNLEPLGAERVELQRALGRSLAVDVVSEVDVPGFDRSNVDGFAVRAADTFGAMEETPRRLKLNAEVLAPAIEPRLFVAPKTATPISTGGMLPRGADAVVMVEDTDYLAPISSSAGDLSAVGSVEVRRAVPPGQNVTFAGTDIAKGETILRVGQLLTSREIGVLAAMGLAEIDVWRRPRVAILSTGNEIVPPGGPLPPGRVYDSNLFILAAAVEELGGAPVLLGVVADDERLLEERLGDALACDVVLLSGGTSKGPGDLSYRVVSRLVQNPGIVAHGVALKPGKPICLAVTDGKPVVILPGFPTSAIFTFHEFVAPVIRALAGRRPDPDETVDATLPLRVNSERGRTEYVLVGLVAGEAGLAAYPMGKGSGSVTTFSCADGFLVIPQQTEIVEAGTNVRVHLLDRTLKPVDFIVIGSHCVGLDVLLGALHRRGYTSKVLNVGSTAGLHAAKRGECDVAGIHLYDPETDQYNNPFLSPGLELIAGYRRMQMFVFRPGDPRFTGRSLDEAVRAAVSDSDCVMVNRNAGSGTRVLIDKLLGEARPAGYAVGAKSHNAVATAITQHRADWGVAIESVVRMYGLGAIPIREEHYDFVVPQSRLDRPAVRAFRELLGTAAVRHDLTALGMRLT
jgi:putative molybdopterin biosynthesis protein